MIETQLATEHEMVLAFLKAEVESPRFGLTYLAHLASWGLNRIARKLLVRLFIMLRDQIDYDEFRRRGRRAPAGAAA